MSRGRRERVETEVREYLLEKEGHLVVEMGVGGQNKGRE